MAQKNAATVTDKWARNLQGSTQSITDGVNAVQTNPAELAIAKKNEMKIKLNAAIDNGKWERGLSRTTVQGWKSAMIDKGVQRVSQGATSGKPKMAAFMQDFLPVAYQVSQQVKSMPKLTPEDSIARVRVAMDAFRQFGAGRR